MYERARMIVNAKMIHIWLAISGYALVFLMNPPSVLPV